MGKQRNIYGKFKTNGFFYRGAIANLSKIVNGAKKILIFTGHKSFENIRPFVEKNLKDIELFYYNDFSSNPKKEEIYKAIENIKPDYDLSIAIGGGSVIDFAKAYRFYTKTDKKLIAIPTTFGTGAESTQFAVIYENGKKKSLDDKSILPDIAIVDSQFSEFNPKYLKASTAMDAYCQAIESYWAVGSTEISREYARQAIELCRDNIVKYVNTSDKIAADNMALASHLSGKAINISRTTASHALSYAITTKYGIPHGHAVALTIAQLFMSNCNIEEININDARGINYLHQIMTDLKNLISPRPIEYFHELFEAIGLEYDFKKLGIEDINYIASQVNLERLKNNPVKLRNLMQEVLC